MRPTAAATRSFRATGDGKLTITITVDDQAAFTAKHISAMEQMGLDERPRVTLTPERLAAAFA